MKKKENNKHKIASILGDSNNRIVVTPDQYNKLTFLNNNRPVKPAHVKSMKESVLRHGVLRLVIVVWSEEKQKYFIVDGQHLTRALQNLNRNIECAVVECESDEDMTQLMIDLNNISKSWKLLDYIHGWAESGNKSYKTLRLEAEKTDVQLSVVLQAYTQKRRGIATKMVKDGKFEITDKKRGDQLISYIKECKNFTPNTRPINEALIQLMVSVGNYDHKRMIKNLSTAMKFVKLSTNEAEIYSQFLQIYNG